MKTCNLIILGLCLGILICILIFCIQRKEGFYLLGSPDKTPADLEVSPLVDQLRDLGIDINANSMTITIPVTMSKNATMNEGVTINGSAQMNNDVTVNSVLTSGGKAILKNGISVNGGATINGSATVNGGAKIDGGATITGNKLVLEGQNIRLNDSNVEIWGAHESGTSGESGYVPASGRIIFNTKLNDRHGIYNDATNYDLSTNTSMCPVQLGVGPKIGAEVGLSQWMASPEEKNAWENGASGYQAWLNPATSGVSSGQNKCW